MDFERYNKEVPQKQPERVPYIAFESELARSERTIRRLIISLVLSVVLIFASNAVWLYVFSQYEYVSEETTTTTVKQDGKGQNVYGDNNKLNEPNNNNSKAKTQKNEKKER